MFFGSEKVTQISDAKVRLPNNGIAYMLTTGAAPLSNMESFYIGMTEPDKMAFQSGWKRYHSLRILRDADFIDRMHNTGVMYLKDGVIPNDKTGYDALELAEILDAVIYDKPRAGQEWRIHSFLIHSGLLVFRLIPAKVVSTSRILEISCSLDHMAGSVLQFGIDIGRPCWQFWHRKQAVNVVCDMTDLPKVQKFAVTTVGKNGWTEIRKIAYIGEFRKGEKPSASTRKFFRGSLETTSRTRVSI